MNQPHWASTLPWEGIREKARAHGLDPVLVAAITQVESSGLSFVTRYEPPFQWLNHPEVWAPKLNVSRITEEIGQKTSWGLMQIMGATARDRGFVGYFPELCLPRVGLEFGCRHLKYLLSRYTRSEDVIAAYNAGNARKIDGKYPERVQKYVDKVFTLFHPTRS